MCQIWHERSSWGLQAKKTETMVLVLRVVGEILSCDASGRPVVEAALDTLATALIGVPQRRLPAQKSQNY